MKVVLTGASGFVGSALGRALQNAEGVDDVIGLVRKPIGELGFPSRVTGELFDADGWQECLEKTEVVIHLAARAHVLSDGHDDPLAEFRRVNVKGALKVAEAALAADVKRFVFVSSIGVNGNETSTTRFSERDTPSPASDYAVSKWEAEQALQRLCSGSGMKLVIVRPPLVYAGHAPGNFRRLMGAVASGLPMPFGAVSNLRSMIALDNLTDFLICCASHPKAGSETFLISDDEDFALPEILRLLAEGMSRRIVQLPVPVVFLKLGAQLLGKEALIEQLCGSLQVDSEKAKVVLGWKPKVSARKALVDSGRNFMRLKSGTGIK